MSQTSNRNECALITILELLKQLLTSRQEKLEVTIAKLKCNFKFQKSQETTLADIV